MNSNENSEIIKNSENQTFLNLSKNESENANNFSASEKTKEWLQIAQEFQDIKKAFNSYKNILLEFVFDKFGYKYKGHIKHPNFLHLSAEAWLLGLFQEIQTELNAEELKENKFTFANLLNLICEIIVKENVFIENMETLIGKFSYLGAYAKEAKIFRSVLIDLNSTKNEVLKDEKIRKNNELNYEGFLNIIEKILLISFNLFLNNINTAEENKKNFTLYEIIQAFKSNEEKKKFVFEEYKNAYIEKKNLVDKALDNNLVNQLLGYFDFASVSFEDLTCEISAFSKNSSSLIYKLYSFLPEKLTFADLAALFQNRFEDILIKYGFDFSRFKNIKNLRYENVKKFIESCYEYSKITLTTSYTEVNSKLHEAKNWINSVEVLQTAKNTSYTLYGKSREYFQIPLEFAQSKFTLYYEPLKTAVLEVKEKTCSYVLTLKEDSQLKVLAFKNLVSDFIASKYQTVKDFVAGENPLLKINKKEDGFYCIEISKKLFFVNSSLFFELFDFVKGILGKVFEIKIVKDAVKALGVENYVAKKEEIENKAE